MKTSDFDTKKILEIFAKHQGQWGFCWEDGRVSWWDGDQQTFEQVFPPGTPIRLIRSKWKNLVSKRKFLGGCDCGCRGDFEITDKGLEFIGQKRTKKYSSY